MQIKKDGVWKPTKQFLGKYNDTWSDGDLWFKVDGVWRQHVPPNAVILYSSTSNINSGYIADGNNSTPNLLNRYVRIRSDDPLTLGGASSHTGSSHGTGGTRYTNYVSSTQACNNLGLTPRATRITSHRHSISSHTHPSTGNNLPSYQNSYPYMYSSKLYSGAVILSSITQVLSALSYLSAYSGYRCRLDNNVTQASKSTAHTHGTVSPAVSDFNESDGYIDNQPSSSPSSWYTIHDHSASHSMPSVTPTYYYMNVIPYSLGSDLYFDELPSGSLVLFTTRRYPDGWSEWKNTGRIIRYYSSAGGYGGSSTHTHSGTKTTGSWINRGSTVKATYENISFNEKYLKSHTHTWTDSHSAAVSNAPPYVNLAIGVKD